MGQDLKVGIVTTANTGGAKATSAALDDVTKSANSAATALTASNDAGKQTATALDSVGQSAAGVEAATKKAGDGAHEAAAGFGDMVKRGSPAHEVLEGILQSGNGSASSMLALTRAVSGLFRVIASGNPMGLFVTALSAAVGGAILLARHLGGVGESAEDMQNKFKAAEETITKVGQASLKNLETSLRNVSEETDRAKVKFAELQAAKERLDNAEQAARLAQNRNDPKKTEEQRTVEEAKIRNEFAKREADRKLADKEEQVKLARSDLSDKQQVSSPAESAAKQAIDNFNKLNVKQGTQEANRVELEGLVKESKTIGTREEDATRNKRINELEGLISKDKKTPVTNDEVALAKKQVETSLKVAETEEKALAVAEQRLKAAEEALQIEKDTQQKEAAFRSQQEKAEFVPKVVKAREEDRTKKAERDNDLADPESERLRQSIAGRQAQVDALKDQQLRSQESSNSPENQKRQAQIDALTQKNRTDTSQIDVFARTPKKLDLLASDQKAGQDDAKKVFDGTPIKDAVKTQTAAFSKAGDETKKEIQATADAIIQQPPIPKTDLEPVRTAQIEYHGQNIELHKYTQQELVQFGKDLRAQANQIASLARQVSQASN